MFARHARRKLGPRRATTFSGYASTRDLLRAHNVGGPRGGALQRHFGEDAARRRRDHALRAARGQDLLRRLRGLRRARLQPARARPVDGGAVDLRRLPVGRPRQVPVLRAEADEEGAQAEGRREGGRRRRRGADGRPAETLDDGVGDAGGAGSGSRGGGAAAAGRPADGARGRAGVEQRAQRREARRAGAQFRRAIPARDSAQFAECEHPPAQARRSTTARRSS